MLDREKVNIQPEIVVGQGGNGQKPEQTSPAPQPPEASYLDMSVNLAGVTLKNPVVVASGTFGFGRE